MTYRTNTFRLIDEQRRKLCIAAVSNSPIGIEVVLREPVKARKLSQNALMWGGPLNDIANQAWVDGKQFSAETWHEQMKRDYLPEDNEPDLERLVKSPETYHKWAITPKGDRVLIGSTTDLTVYGFSQYLEQVYSMGASIGVQFTTPKEYA